MNKVRILLLLAVTIATINTRAYAGCPYDSVQIRVQINTNTHWGTSAQVALDEEVHIGVFKNGWGVPIDQGGVTVYAVQGSYHQVVPLSGWEAKWKPGVAVPNDTWTFHVYCHNRHDQAQAVWGGQVDVLSYVLPNWPQSDRGSINSVITNKGNYWRTYFDPNDNVNERLPGFFITKGGIDYGYDPFKMWQFEQMIYDNDWIYLVRDTSWDKLCTDNSHVAGQLLFLYDGAWLRGGPHFPRFIANGDSISTGSKYVQGVERKRDTSDAAQEGRWCTAQCSGTTSSTVKVAKIGRVHLGDRWFNDTLKISIVAGSATSDQWWFAKGFGLIYFKDDNQTERFNTLAPDYKVRVRIPCEPNPPCM